MFYKCLECGHIFEDGEESRWVETHGLSNPPYEHFSGCPICGGSYEETEVCNGCGGDYLPDDLIGGYCKECLHDLVTYDNALAYMEDRTLLDLFMFEWWGGCVVPDHVPDRIHRVMREQFIREKARDRLMEETEFRDLCTSFCMDEPDDFADWLVKKERG